jgi:D-inositol-3-phosphate glycosyltransferase
MYTLIVTPVPMLAEASKTRNPAAFPITGARVAAAALLTHLARHSRADCILLPVPNANIGPEHEAWLSALPNRDRVRFVPYDRLHDLRASTRVVIFSIDSDMAYGAYLRAAFGDSRWVVSAVTHALNSLRVIAQIMLLHLHRMQSYDVLICTSTASHDAVTQLFGAAECYLSDRLRVETRCPIQLPVIPLPAPISSPSAVSRSDARATLGLPSAGTIFLCLGRFSDTTKTDLNPLLIAFSLLSARCEDVMLVLAGDDTMHRAAPALTAFSQHLGLAERVHVIPDPPESTKALLYAAADVFVSLVDNVQETFGLTLLEAMEAGLPVVASDWSGYRDIVRHGETGMLIPSHWADCVSSVDVTAPLVLSQETNWTLAQTVAVDLAAAVAAMERLARDRNLRQTMGEAGRARVRDTFSGAAVVKAYEDVWCASLDVAASTAPTDHPVEGLTVCNYFRAFGGFASDLVSTETVFTISETGRRWLSGELELPVLDSDRGGFDSSELKGLLARIGEHDAATATTFLGHARDDRALRHLLRLAKYGLLDITPGAHTS